MTSDPCQVLPVTATAIAGYAQVFATVLEGLGLNYREIFAEAGVELGESIDPMQRISNQQVGQLFFASIKLTNNPYLGIDIGNAFQPGHLHALGYGLLASTSLRDFYQRVEKYYRVASQNADFTHFTEGDSVVLCATPLRADLCAETQDVWVAIMVRMMRLIYQRPLNPIYIELMRSCPDSGEKPYLDNFNCPVRFGCDRIKIALDRTIMDRRLPAASEELAMYNDKIVMEYLEKLDKADIVTRVRRLVVRDLASGDIRKDEISRELGMSTRNMQIKLAEADTSFQHILESSRRELAMSYIQQRHMSITEIAFLLGFTDASNFTRAFRRWAGVSPSQFRHRSA